MTKTYAKADHSALLVELAESVSALSDSSQWAKYLEFQSKFYRYSAGNVQLILLQNPYATRVAGFNAWKKLGRSVKKGEKGLYILAPMIKKTEDESTGETSTNIFGFRFVAVFDVAQTEGDELPEISSKLHGDDPDDLFGSLTKFAGSIGFEVIGHDFDGGANGDCSHATKVIRVEVRNSPVQRVKTLAHELAHAILHSPETTDYSSDRARCELEAESTAFVVLRALGIDSGDYSFGYVAGWAGGGDAAAELIKRTSERVQKTAARILADFEVEAGE